MDTKTKQSLASVIAPAFLLPLLRGAYFKTLFTSSGSANYAAYSLYGMCLILISLVFVVFDSRTGNRLDGWKTTVSAAIAGFIGIALCLSSGGFAVLLGSVLIASFVSFYLVAWTEILARFPRLACSHALQPDSLPVFSFILFRSFQTQSPKCKCF